jgi:subtilisin family serine protease
MNRRLGWTVLLLSVAAALGGPRDDAKIDRGLLGRLSDDENAAAPFFVVFAEKANVKPAHRIANRGARGRFVVQALQATASRSQNAVRGRLQARGVAFTPFWVENKIYVPNGTLELARDLAQRPEVAAIIPEVVYPLAPPRVAADASTQAIEWGVSKIRAPEVWPATTGTGIVVANIDTGVQYNHPALVGKYRGNTGGAFNHLGSWKDPTGNCAAGTPCDNNNHGTHTMGTMVGSDGTNQIGVAPGAKWIACKGCASNSCLTSHLIACAQWVLDPYGNNSGAGQPNVVNNSWGGGQGDSWYQSYVQNWRAAGIFPAFSAGNSGSACNTANSPGDYPESYASGATDISDVLASFSSRGPSSFAGILKPDIAAPGVGVRSSVPTNTFASFSGTSMASPHTAGAVALLWAAAPSYAGNVAATETLLEQNAVKLVSSTQSCGGIPTGVSPNNVYGNGRLDIRKAVDATGVPANQPPLVSLTPPPANGTQFTCAATVNFGATASDPENGNLTGSITWTDNGTAFGGGGGTASRTYDCTMVGLRTIVARVTDLGGASDTDTVTIQITNSAIPAAPSNLSGIVSGRTINLTWTDNANNETGFVVERKLRNASSWSVVKSVTSPSASDTVSSGGWYNYRVKAVNGTMQSAPSNTITKRLR